LGDLPTLILMFERFTNLARHAVVLAQEEARRQQHNYIGTEHILLAMLEEEDADGPLHRLGVDKTRAEADLAAALQALTSPA
jgi:ATP-dependent Clp protease ATP-binding subunit ClpA